VEVARRERRRTKFSARDADKNDENSTICPYVADKKLFFNRKKCRDKINGEPDVSRHFWKSLPTPGNHCKSIVESINLYSLGNSLHLLVLVADQRTSRPNPVQCLHTVTDHYRSVAYSHAQRSCCANFVPIRGLLVSTQDTHLNIYANGSSRRTLKVAEF
jgi:hypothetical protein